MINSFFKRGSVLNSFADPQKSRRGSKVGNPWFDYIQLQLKFCQRQTTNCLSLKMSMSLSLSLSPLLLFYGRKIEVYQVR